MKEETRLRNELIIADYNNGYAIKILERKYELSHTSLLRVLKENGVEFKMGRVSLKPHTIDNIVKLYEMGKSTQQIVKELKLSKSSVEKYIREYKKGVGIEIGTQKFKGTHYRKANETSKLYISDYVKGISVNEIAKKYGVSRQRVYQAIKSSKKGKKEWEKIKSK